MPKSPRGTSPERSRPGETGSGVKGGTRACFQMKKDGISIVASPSKEKEKGGRAEASGADEKVECYFTCNYPELRHFEVTRKGLVLDFDKDGDLTQITIGMRSEEDYKKVALLSILHSTCFYGY